MAYTASELRAMPTIKQGPVNDLKVDTGRYRVWVRRGDGGPVIVMHERRGQRWEVIGTYSERLTAAAQRLVERSSATA